MKTLRSKFFLLILLPVIAVLVLFQVRNYRTAHELLVDQMEKSARNFLWAASESLSGNINTIRTILSLETIDENISHKSDSERRQMFVTLTWELGPSVTSVYMGYPDGRMIRGASTELPSDYDPRQRPWYRSALQLPEGQLEGVTAPYLDAGTGHPVITFFRKVMNSDQTLVGVMGVDIDVQTASQSISHEHPIPSGGRKILVKSDGTILIHPEHNKVGTALDASGEPMDRQIANDIRAAEIPFQRYMDERQGVLWYAGFHRVADTDLAIVFMVPANSVLTPLQKLHMEIVGLGSALVILLLILLVIMLRRITQPLIKLTHSAVNIAHDGTYQDPLDVKSRDEVGKLTQAFNGMMEGLRQRDFIRETFGRYVTKEVVEQLLETPDGLKLGGESREVTIMLCDLRGFTPLTEHLEPDQVVNLLNRYLEQMESIISEHQGTINEFLGDAILTFFGAPVQFANHAEKAVSCGVAMQLAMQDLNDRNAADGLPPLSMGIGINTGNVIVGNIGSQNRAKYGVVGHTINLTSRVEGSAIGGQVLITETTLQKVQSHVETRGTRTINLKGVDQGVTIYDVQAVGEPIPMRLPDEIPLAQQLEKPVPMNAHVMKGKAVDGESMVATLTHFSLSWARITIDSKIDIAREIRLDIGDPASEKPVSVYARVVSVELCADGNAHWVKISYISSEAEHLIRQFNRG